MTVRVALIGLGRIGALLEEDHLRKKPCTHLGAWKSIPDVSEIVVAEPNPERLKAVCRKYEVRGYADHNVMFATEPRFDIISIATPVETHREVFGDTPGDKKKAAVVFCEKPIASTVKDAETMVRLSKELGIKLAINHTRRWEPVYQDAAKRLKAKEFGDVVDWFGIFSGDFVNDGVHMADLANWYNLSEGHGLNVSSVNTNFIIFEIEIFCEKGRITIMDNGRAYLLYTSSPSINYEGFRELVGAPGDLGGAHASTKTPMQRACEQLVRCATSNEEPLCTGEDGLIALKMAEEGIFGCSI